MLESDLLIDRRRLKRRLNFWRVLAVAAIVATLVVIALPRGAGFATEHLARINVSGVITEDRKLADSIRRIGDDGSVPAVILAIDSPGGSVAGGESLHAALKQLAAKKPIVAVMGGTAASAGYMIAMPTQRIFAHESTLTGSIGVILQTVEFSGLLHTLGVAADAITSGPLKDQPSVSRPLTPEGRAYLDGVVQDMYDQFVEKVAAGRRMDPAEVRKFADGRAYTGRQAKSLGLIDEIGGEPEARAWLMREKGVSDALPVRDVDMRSLYQRTVGAALSGMIASLTGAAEPGAWSIWTGR